MKVLHLSTFQQQGGAAIAASRLNHALVKQGIDSHLFVQKGSKEEEYVMNWDSSSLKKKLYWGYFIAERLYFMPYEVNKSVRYAFSPARVGIDLHKHPLVVEADIIQLHWINFGFLSLKSIQQLINLGKPIVWTMHDMWAFTGGCHYSRGCERFKNSCQKCPYLRKPSEDDLSSRIFQKKIELYKGKNITLVAPSTWLKDLAQNATLGKKLRAEVIPNPIDTTFYQPQNKYLLREKLGLPTSKKLVLFVGANTMDPRKGFIYFQRAVNELYQKESDFEIVVFGKSQDTLSSLLLPPLHNFGSLNNPVQIAELYAACDVLVAPSLEDNLPNTIMESMACGTPVVGFKTGGIPDMIDHKINGYIAEYTSADSLAEGIQWTLQYTEQLAQQARKKVLHTYDEKIIAQQYIDLYTSLLPPK